MIEFEARHGRPAETVIAEAINAQGSIAAAARALNLSHNTLFGWALRLGIRVEMVAKPPAEVA